MRAIVYEGHEGMRVDTVPDPALIDENDILLEVEKTAICGSDLHLWHLEDPEAAGIVPGFTVGHEFLGTVRERGSSVETLNVNDRVLVSCTIGCGRCEPCRRGYYSGCRTMTADGTITNVFGFGADYPGGQAEAVRVPAADVNCFKLPADLSDEQCLFLTDILPTGFMGTELAQVAAGDVVVVFGCGPVGTFAQVCALVRGAATVIAVDLDDERLERARQRGCVTINPSSEDTLERVLEITHGEGADKTIEAVGVPDLVTMAATVTRPGGIVAVIGVILGPWEIQWPLFFSKNLSLRTGLVNPQVSIPQLLPLIREGRLDPADIISHRLSLDEGTEAYRLFAEHRDNVLKVVLSP